MIIDLRTRTVVPGRLKAYLALYEAQGLPVQRRHQPNLIGYSFLKSAPGTRYIHGDMKASLAVSNEAPHWRPILTGSPIGRKAARQAMCSTRETRYGNR